MDSDLQAEVAAGVEPPAALTEQTAPAVEYPPVVEDVSPDGAAVAAMESEGAPPSTDFPTSDDVAKSEEPAADHTITVEVEADTSAAQAALAEIGSQLSAGAVALDGLKAQAAEFEELIANLRAQADARIADLHELDAQVAARKAAPASVDTVPDGVIVNAERTAITIRTTVTSGDELFALFDVLAPYGRELFGNHNGLYVEKVG